MQELPHHYHASAVADGDIVRVSCPDAVNIETAAPVQFGGPGDLWSPETLFTAAIANCIVLTFKAIARASRLSWSAIECNVETILDRVERKTLFTQAIVRVKLTIDNAEDREKAEKLLEKSESNCLVSNSLKTEIRLEPEIVVSETTA